MVGGAYTRQQARLYQQQFGGTMRDATAAVAANARQTGGRRTANARNLIANEQRRINARNRAANR